MCEYYLSLYLLSENILYTYHVSYLNNNYYYYHKPKTYCRAHISIKYVY